MTEVSGKLGFCKITVGERNTPKLLFQSGVWRELPDQNTSFKTRKLTLIILLTSLKKMVYIHSPIITN